MHVTFFQRLDPLTGNTPEMVLNTVIFESDEKMVLLVVQNYIGPPYMIGWHV